MSNSSSAPRDIGLQEWWIVTNKNGVTVPHRLVYTSSTSFIFLPPFLKVITKNPWAPYDTYKDCYQGICSIYCPQWCYILGPPPPPFYFAKADDSKDSATDFSPLIIAVIGIFASAFILVTYYTIILKYCWQRDNDGGRDIDMENSNPNQVSESWQGSTTGLDESLIKSIKVHKYKRGDSLVEGTDCSVCLSEFEENESLRLLPKCSHAFHVPCIDTWLKSHSSCPLCRSNIAAPAIASVPHHHQQVMSPVQENPPQEQNVTASEYQHRSHASVLVVQDLEEVVSLANDHVVPMPQLKILLEKGLTWRIQGTVVRLDKMGSSN